VVYFFDIRQFRVVGKYRFLHFGLGFWIWSTSGLEELELWKACAMCRFVGWREGHRNI